jgi:hypothetical protein
MQPYSRVALWQRVRRSSPDRSDVLAASALIRKSSPEAEISAPIDDARRCVGQQRSPDRVRRHVALTHALNRAILQAALYTS